MNKNNLLLSKNQYLLLSLSLILIVGGFSLMSGGALQDPKIFDESALFSFRRTKLASFIVVFGYGLIYFVIFKIKANSSK